MYKALQQAASQEASYKTAIEELNRKVAAQRRHLPLHKEALEQEESALQQAHSAFESLISAEWGPAVSLSSISEDCDDTDAASPRAMSGQGGSPSKGNTGASNASRMLELQRQVLVGLMLSRQPGLKRRD
jgi:hypothetical protein